jgi:hypothetical protein
MKVPYLLDELQIEMIDQLHDLEDKALIHEFEKHGYTMDWILKHINQVFMVEALNCGDGVLIQRTYSVKEKPLFSSQVVLSVDEFGNYSLHIGCKELGEKKEDGRE